jgi:predicted ester cyclase
MPEQDNIRIALEYMEGLNAHAYDRLQAYHGDSFQSLLPGQPGPVDEAGHRGFLQSNWAAFPDLTFLVTETIASGDYVVVNWIATGTHSGPMIAPTGVAIPPTGRQGSVPGSTTNVFKDSRLVRADVYFDTATLLAQLGLMPGA